MNQKLRIIIGDTGDSFAITTADAIRLKGEWAVTRPQTEAALHNALTEQPDAILLNITNLEMDYAAFARQSQQLINTSIFAVLHTQNLFLENVLRRAGVHCRHLPLEPNVLLADIRSCVGNRSMPQLHAAKNKPQNAVTDLLLAIGIPMNLQGFQFLRCAILIAMEKQSLQSGWVMREIYPAVAQEMKSTSARVERSIRNAIMRAWENVSDHQNAHIAILSKRRMTNSEFILYAVNRLRSEHTHYDQCCG